MLNFPTATEVRYHWFLTGLLEDIEEACRTRFVEFLDITLSNRYLEEYLVSKGFTLVGIRYEYNENKEWGFWGRTDGDGICMTRIIWGDVDWAMAHNGDYRA